MSPEDYFNGPTFLLKAYREAWRARLEHEDSAAWLNGLYAGRAVASVLVGEKSPYPERPFSQRAPERGAGGGGGGGGMAYMDSFAAAFNRKRRETAEKGAGEEG